MSNHLVVATNEFPCSNPTTHASIDIPLKKPLQFENLKLSSQLPPGGNSPPKNGHIIQYLENILNQSHLKLNAFSYQHHKMCSDLNF